MAVQESAAQLSMTLKVQEYPTLKPGRAGGRCPGLSQAAAAAAAAASPIARPGDGAERAAEPRFGAAE
ncbi:UNVERIFIED_CONTAM: hypothetical protein K2H54_008780 [Gekko kuhli]